MATKDVIPTEAFLLKLVMLTQVPLLHIQRQGYHSTKKIKLVVFSKREKCSKSMLNQNTTTVPQTLENQENLPFLPWIGKVWKNQGKTVEKEYRSGINQDMSFG